MGFNADQLQKSEKAEVAGGIDIVECIKAHQHVGPVAHGHINFRGCAPQLFGVGADPVDHPRRGPMDS